MVENAADRNTDEGQRVGACRGGGMDSMRAVGWGGQAKKGVLVAVQHARTADHPDSRQPSAHGPPCRTTDTPTSAQASVPMCAHVAWGRAEIVAKHHNGGSAWATARQPRTRHAHSTSPRTARSRPRPPRAPALGGRPGSRRPRGTSCRYVGCAARREAARARAHRRRQPLAQTSSALPGGPAPRPRFFHLACLCLLPETGSDTSSPCRSTN